MSPLSHQPGFHCPVCGSEGYVYVTTERPDGSRRATSLFQCCGCSTAFTDPEKFTARKRLVLQRSGMSEVWTLVPSPDQVEKGASAKGPDRKVRK